MAENLKDTLNSGRRFVLGTTDSSRLELDFFNLYTWLLQFVKDKYVLDIACGSGLGSFLLAHKAKEVWGVDLSPDALEFAKERYHLTNLKFFVSDIFSFNLPAGYFDVVVSAMTLEQLEVERHEPFLRILKSALQDQGRIFLVTPNKRITSPWQGQGGGYHWNKKEYFKTELLKLFKSVNLIPMAWFGRRRVFRLWTFFLVRKFIGLLQRVFKKNFGCYGQREPAEVKPVNFFWQPKDFVVILRKVI